MTIHHPNLFTPDSAQKLIDQAAASGIKVSDLRWTISTAQRIKIVKVLQMISPQEILRYEYEHGAQDTGMFAGVPYVVDSTLKEGELRLDVMERSACFALVLCLPVGPEW